MLLRPHSCSQQIINGLSNFKYFEALCYGINVDIPIPVVLLLFQVTLDFIRVRRQRRKKENLNNDMLYRLWDILFFKSYCILLVGIYSPIAPLLRLVYTLYIHLLLLKVIGFPSNIHIVFYELDNLYHIQQICDKIIYMTIHHLVKPSNHTVWKLKQQNKVLNRIWNIFHANF